MRLLLAEDERDMNQIISKKLSNDGYAIDSCFDGLEALDYIETTEYDVLILDIMMPKLDGLSLLERIRKQNNNTPVLLLTAKDAISDRVKGLDSGANDYLVKPFALDELLARIRVLTRSIPSISTNMLVAGDLTMDINQHTIFRGETEITLPSKEFALLEYLLRNKNIVLTREKIESNIWNYDFEGGSNVIDVYIRYLRKKMDEPFDKKLIRTVRGVGYVLRDVE